MWGSTCERGAVNLGNRHPRCPAGSEQGFGVGPFLGVSVSNLLCRHSLPRLLWLFLRCGLGPGAPPPWLCMAFPGLCCQGFLWAHLVWILDVSSGKRNPSFYTAAMQPVPGKVRGCNYDSPVLDATDDRILAFPVWPPSPPGCPKRKSIPWSDLCSAAVPLVSLSHLLPGRLQ